MDWTIRPSREVATWMLAQLFADDAAPPPDRTFPLAPFQEAAVARARGILARRGGVVVADAVGLGKTFVALALIEAELARGGVVLVAIPAALRSVWRGPLRRLRVASRGDVHILSHAQLSRGGYPSGLGGRLGLVVVDEAHRFRNARTRRHAALTDLCSGARVVLLTATPVNNGLGDLHSLLRLFARDDAFRDIGVPSLRELLVPVGPGAGGGDAPGPAGPALRRVLGEVVVQRTRAAVQDQDQKLDPAGVTMRFPRRAPLTVVRYDDERVAAVAAAIGALELAPYRVAARAGLDAGNAITLVRLGLLKRLESGVAPLTRSVRRQLAFCRSFLAALDSGRLLRPHDPGPGVGPGDRDPLQLILVDLVAEPWPPGLDATAVRGSIQRDIERLSGIRSSLAGPDPKLDALIAAVVALAPEKVVIFTEFRDTAEAIWRALMGVAPVGRIDGGGAWLGARPAGRGAVVDRFAPRSNGVKDPPLRERVDVLIATDVLAEGMNLQDARHVISYDLPWNPVRLMQRIGRVDRLGSPHDLVVPHLFLPAAGLEELLGLMRRLRTKLGSIADTVGGDDAIEIMARLGAGDSEAAARAIEAVHDRGQDPMERLRSRWHTLATSAGMVGRTTDVGPAAHETVAGPEGSVLVGVVAPSAGDGPDLAPGAVVLLWDRDRPRLVEVRGEGSRRATYDAGARAAHLFHAALDSECADRPAAALREARRFAYAALEHLGAMAAAARAPLPVRAADPAARIARILRASLAGQGARTGPAAIARTDRVLQRLTRPLPGRAAREAVRLLGTLEETDSLEAILDRVEELLGRGADHAHPDAGERGPDPTAPTRPQRPEARVLAVLVTARIPAPREALPAVDDPDRAG